MHNATEVPHIHCCWHGVAHETNNWSNNQMYVVNGEPIIASKEYLYYETSGEK